MSVPGVGSSHSKNKNILRDDKPHPKFEVIYIFIPFQVFKTLNNLIEVV